MQQLSCTHLVWEKEKKYINWRLNNLKPQQQWDSSNTHMRFSAFPCSRNGEADVLWYPWGFSFSDVKSVEEALCWTDLDQTVSPHLLLLGAREAEHEVHAMFPPFPVSPSQSEGSSNVLLLSLPFLCNVSHSFFLFFQFLFFIFIVIFYETVSHSSSLPYPRHSILYACPHMYTHIMPV